MSQENEDVNDQWLSLDDISLLQQSLLDTHNESSILGFQGCGLEDLSCSLIHCNGLEGEGGGECGDHESAAALIDMGCLRGELERSRGLDSVFGAGDEEGTRNCSENYDKETAPHCVSITVETQTELNSENAIVQEPAKTAIHKAVQCTLKSLNSKITKNSDQFVTRHIPSEISQTDSHSVQYNKLEQGIQIESKKPDNEEHNKSYESDEFNIDLHGSPNPLAMQPTKDMFRLTFSPSICEYEAESHSSCKRSEHELAIVEDLKLQLIDSDRKFEATKKYLEEMTAEREQEREDYQRCINDLVVRCEEIKKEKDKLEVVVSQQKTELEDVVENLQESNRIKDEVLLKSLGAEDELKLAVEKICELRDIIRTLEEQVEEATRHATMYSNARKVISEDSVAEELSKTSCIEAFRQHDDEGASELDITVELQAQVQELAKRIEEKLVELENFSWQTRPGSSCSVKSGDDVSVRAADRVHFNDDHDTTDQDIVSQVFCGLRRLEYSFDTLVRFEEVLLKKIKDADLKISNDNKRLEELVHENNKLRQDLGLCRQKILDFENFMSNTQKTNSETSIPRAEALRTYGHSFTSRFEDSSPGIKRPRLKGEMEIEQPMDDDDLDDLEQYGEGVEQYGFDETGTKGTKRNDQNAGPAGSKNQNPDLNPNGGNGVMDTGNNELPMEYGSDEFTGDDSTFDANGIEVPLAGKPKANAQDRGLDGQNSPLSGLVLETTLEDGKRPGGPGQNGVDNNSGSGPGQNGAGNTGKNDISSPSNERDNPKNKDGKKGDEDEDVITYDITTVSDYEVDGDNLKYIGSTILPSEDPNGQSDDQLNRLQGTDAKVELEKLKTKMDQLQRALEAERQKTQELAQQLNEVINGPEYPLDTALDDGDDDINMDYVDDLERTLQEKDEVECKLKRNLECATMAYQQLEEENQQLRGYVEQLELDLDKIQYYSSQNDPEP